VQQADWRRFMAEVVPGPRNLITDVEGITVGNAEDRHVRTGVTVLVPQWPVVASCDVRGGAPGTRETDALDPACLVETVHGFVLSGGSVFGLDAASAVTSWLAARGVGFTFGAQPLPAPVVPSAILFDLANGGDKSWGMAPPYHALGLEACAALKATFRLGNAGAGLGAVAGSLKGGLGSASSLWNGFTLGALVAVNSAGSAIAPATGELWAAAHALGDELPALKRPPTSGGSLVEATKFERWRGTAASGANTTIAIIATDAALTKSEAKRIAVMAHDGMARALRPTHTPFDGDSVFALSTGLRPLADPRAMTLSHLGAIAADTLTRAIGRALWEAETIGGVTCYRDTSKSHS
jgi:L-aminopeptidase/D-esterase-like protein